MNDITFFVELKPYTSMTAYGQKNALNILMALLFILVPAILAMKVPLLLIFLLSPAFMLLAAFFAWNRSLRLRETVESSETLLTVRRIEPNGHVREFKTDPYWVKIELRDDGPVEHYLTLRDQKRHVEIGAFLTSDKRIELYHRLLKFQKKLKHRD